MMRGRICLQKTSWSEIITASTLTHLLTNYGRDYAPDAALDRYDARDIDDDEEAGELTAEQRRAAERDMALRDRREARRGQGGRAARRSNAPDFLRDEDEIDDEDMLDGGLLSDLTKRRTRRQYDERQNVDDAAGTEGVSSKALVLHND